MFFENLKGVHTPVGHLTPPIISKGAHPGHCSKSWQNWSWLSSHVVFWRAWVSGAPILQSTSSSHQRKINLFCSSIGYTRY